MQLYEMFPLTCTKNVMSVFNEIEGINTNNHFLLVKKIVYRLKTAIN